MATEYPLPSGAGPRLTGFHNHHFGKKEENVALEILFVRRARSFAVLVRLGQNGDATQQVCSYKPGILCLSNLANAEHPFLGSAYKPFVRVGYHNR